MGNIRIPFLGWTFAGDFLNSKMTHLAFFTLATSATLYQQHKFSLVQCLGFGFLSLAAAFLRDTHSKNAEIMSNLIVEVLNNQHFPTEPAGDGGEADGPALIASTPAA